MPIDRETTVRQAEKLQRQGRLDLAIAEYVKLVQEQPRDWNAINALGDLYLQAGDTDRAVAQFVQIADHLFGEGFFPKAAALYKKALKTRSDHEHTLLRLAEIAAAQELLADARAYLRKLWELRSERGDDRGAAECLVSETAGGDPDLLLALGQIQIGRSDDSAARTTLTRFIVAAPERSSDVLRLAGELGRAGEPHRAFACTEIVVDDAVLRADWDRASASSPARRRGRRRSAAD